MAHTEGTWTPLPSFQGHRHLLAPLFPHQPNTAPYVPRSCLPSQICQKKGSNYGLTCTCTKCPAPRPHQQP